MQIPLTSVPATVGLGLRRGLIKDLQAAPEGAFDFLEVAPENWIGVGGAHGAAYRAPPGWTWRGCRFIATWCSRTCRRCSVAPLRYW
ncbi:DUF692 family protein [Pseudomonas sp. B21-015]|nr:DUF692 family multinuclear iron-containing protein [Pseudomonas sp. B21-015]UVM48228.1 DUF692 family protein [Pseudomonas sp. B21-015]